MGAVWASLRRNLGRGAVDWSSAGGAVWVSAWVVMAGDWRLPRRRGPRFHDYGGERAARRPVARRNGADRDERGIGPGGGACESLHTCARERGERAGGRGGG